MIVVFHNRKKVTGIHDFRENRDLTLMGAGIKDTLLRLSKDHDCLFMWCHQDLKTYIDLNNGKDVFRHDMIMASFSTSGKYVIPSGIGYVDSSSPFLKVKTDVSYPTWLMSSDIGGISAKVLSKFWTLSGTSHSFDEFLNHVSKASINKGLLCYSEPRLLKKGFSPIDENKKKTNLFGFVKNHYKGRWLFLLFINYFLYERKLKLGLYLKALFKSRYDFNDLDFSDIKIMSVNHSVDSAIEYDVLIPTLGRAKYLHDVLEDLAKQTILPNTVIIVEQNDKDDAKTELGYVYDKAWPFKIDHQLINQLGACNARNLGMKKVASPWLFFADDDIRLKSDLIENAFDFISQYGVNAITMACLRENEKLHQTFPVQWHTFGSGCSIVKSNLIENIAFGMEHELAFGEDSDFGMKLRNEGSDIIFFPNTALLHLKAPIGGFRARSKHPWEEEVILPKPSPSIMAYRLKHLSKEQLSGYRTTLFLKYFKEQKNKNPFSYYSMMSKKWNRSIYWAKELIKKYSPDAV